MILLVGAYYIGANGPNKFIKEYEQFREQALETNDSVLKEVAALRETISQKEDQYAKTVTEQTMTINRLTTQLRNNTAKIDAAIVKLDAEREDLDTLPEVCAPALRLADNYKFQLDDARFNLVVADSALDEQEKRNNTQMLRIENMRYGFERANIAIDTLGNIIGDLPKPPKFRVLGLAIPKEVVFVAGVATGALIAKN